MYRKLNRDKMLNSDTYQVMSRMTQEKVQRVAICLPLLHSATCDDIKNTKSMVLGSDMLREGLTKVVISLDFVQSKGGLPPKGQCRKPYYKIPFMNIPSKENIICW